MGWGAAQAFYEENSSWLGGVDDAYDFLYGEDKPPAKNRCPICNKKRRGPVGVSHHMVNFHVKEKHQPRITEFCKANDIPVPPRQQDGGPSHDK